MGDEIGHVAPLGQFARMGRRSVEHDDGATGLHVGDEGFRDLADQRIRHRHQHHVGIAERGITLDAIGPGRILEPLPPLLGDLDMHHLIGRALEVGCEPHPHLPAGAEQRDLRHRPVTPSSSGRPRSIIPK